MEFLPDAENNARNVAFLNKTKNQAKKLFKLAKENSLKIEINNLSHAQEILAQINLEKYLNIPILRKADKVYSFLSVTYLPSNYDDFVSLINSLMKATMFQYNMGFHHVEISIEQHIIESIPQGTYQYFNYNENLGMPKEEFESLFKINVAPKPTNEKNFGIDINLCILTDENMLDEHIKFCKIFTSSEFEKHFNFNESFNDEELQKYSVDEENSKKFVIPGKNPHPSSPGTHIFKLEDMLIYHDIVSKNHPCPIEHTKWIHALYLLSQRAHQWKILVSMNESVSTTKIFRMSHSRGEDATTTNINDKYLLGLFRSLTNTQLNAYADISDTNLKVFSYNGKNHRVLPWNSGLPLVNVSDNSIDYYQPASTMQSNYNTLIFAKPGSGKSLLMSILNLGIAYNHTLSKMPRIGIVDIGPASVSIIELIKNSLPVEKRHLVQHHKIKMSSEYCVNVFDTQLGCRFPTNTHLEYLTNFLLLLSLNVGYEKPEPGMSGLVQAIIHEMYYRSSDKGTPKRYDKGVNITVDEALIGINFQSDYRTTWWEVVDQLFLANRINEATIAQRYAVPLLSEAIMAVQSEKIREIYSRVTVSTGETVVEAFNRSITNSISRYKILTSPTVFDISEARIACLDLDEVAKSGGAQAEMQTGVMYMLANYILSKNYKLNYDSLNEMPYSSTIEAPSIVPVYQYKLYHKNRLEETKEDFKQLCYDEFHRTAKVSLVKEQIIADMRYAIKWSMGITLASQSIYDFESSITSLAATTFIMDSGNSRDQKQIGEIFNLHGSDFALLNNVHGPRSGKSGVMLAKIITNEGTYTKLLSLPINPMLLTALSTTSEDVIVKNKLSQILGYWNAIRLMSKYYPSGVKKVFEMRKEIALKHKPSQEIDEEILYKEVTNEILAKEYKAV